VGWTNKLGKYWSLTRVVLSTYAFFITTNMETSFALTGKGYVIVAADTTAARSIVKMKIDQDKIKDLSPHLLMAYSGEPGQHNLITQLVIF
jgi:20S proteasome alpha/beta subunit